MPELYIGEYQVLFDDCDIELVMSRNWNIKLGWKGAPYARHADGHMHQLIMKTPKGMMTDHINHNTLDNRRENLRVVTRSQNMRNQKSTCGTSRYKGVYWRKDVNKWRAQITLDRKRVSLGFYEKEDDAALAYNAAAVQNYGDSACLNVIAPYLPKEK